MPLSSGLPTQGWLFTRVWDLPVDQPWWTWELVRGVQQLHGCMELLEASVANDRARTVEDFEAHFAAYGSPYAGSQDVWQVPYVIDMAQSTVEVRAEDGLGCSCSSLAPPLQRPLSPLPLPSSAAKYAPLACFTLSPLAQTSPAMCSCPPSPAGTHRTEWQAAAEGL